MIRICQNLALILVVLSLALCLVSEVAAKSVKQDVQSSALDVATKHLDIQQSLSANPVGLRNTTNQNLTIPSLHRCKRQVQDGPLVSELKKILGVNADIGEDWFHIIQDRDIQGLIDIYNIKSDSSLDCALRARALEEKFAVWRADRCYFKRTERVGRLLTRYGELIGNYNLLIPNAKSSFSSQDRDEWARTGECDLIQEYAGYGYHCKKFSHSPGTVMMFKYQRRSR